MDVGGVKKFVGAIAILCGTIIGVGIFGLPYVAWQAGYGVVLLYLAWGTFAATLAALVFGELIAVTPGRHRAPGYVRRYLGRRWGRLVFVSAVTGLFGGQLVYLLVGGHFLAQLVAPFAPLPEPYAIVLYAAAGAGLVAGRNWVLARAELLLLPIFIGAMGLIIVRALPAVNPAHLDDLHLANLVLPYGVVMFSMWGLTAVAECREYLGQRYVRLLRPAVLTAFPLCALAYAVFTGAVLGATGPAVTPDGLDGLRQRLGDGIGQWFYVFGLLTTFTSYISFGRTLKKIFIYDAHWRETLAWIAAVTVPLGLYLTGINNFVLIMGLIGAVTLGFDTISLLTAYRASQRITAPRAPYRLRLSSRFVAFLVAVLGAGIFSTIAYVLVSQSV